jgi:hypothetical protein
LKPAPNYPACTKKGASIKRRDQDEDVDSEI